MYLFKMTKDIECTGCCFNDNGSCSQPTNLNCCQQDFSGIWIKEEDMDELRQLAAMRSMAWERAKGELQSMEHTFYGAKEKFNKINEAITEFIKYVEDNGLQE